MADRVAQVAFDDARNCAWDLVIEIDFLGPLPDVDDLAVTSIGSKSLQMYYLSTVR